MSGQNKHRALFMSDFHLGSPHCQAERLLNFLRCHSADKLYLVGDILEVSEMRRWPPFHTEIIGELFNKGTAGTEVIYIPGNHDAIFRAHEGKYGNLRIENYAYHGRARGDLLFVTHGDDVDRFRSKWLLDFLMTLERRTGGNYWELLRRHFTRIILRHAIAFEARMIALAREHGYSGILCGHIHAPKIIEGDVLYLNSGDWIRHCTAIAEDDSGNFKILNG